MESKTWPCSASDPQKASNYDEIFMQHSLVFADSLKDLKNLKKQLYSAADYFELSYCDDNQRPLVVETLKDYITNALISTIDHLGSVAFKVNCFLDENIDGVSGTELRFSCIEQRLRTCQEFIDRGGLYHHSLLIKIPKHHKHYIIPAAETMHAIGKSESIYNNCNPCAERNSYQSKLVTRMKPPSSTVRKGNSRLSSMVTSSPRTFSFTRILSNKELERNPVSSHISLQRSGSLISSSIIPNSSNAKLRYSSELQRSASLSIHGEKDMTKEIQQYSRKSKPLFRALLSMHKQKKDERL
ncbi:hypothetical protein ACSBR2_041297 [Camellia fascicularis]